MRRIRPAMLMVVLGLAACTLPGKEEVKPRPVISAPPPSKGEIWQDIASSEDANRIRRLGTAWSMGLAEARQGGFEAEIREEGKLLNANAAQAKPAPTPGSYSCRMIRLGKENDRRGPAFQKFKPFFCYVGVEGDLFTIVKQTGSQRPAGRLWEDDNPSRMVFLGTLALGDEEPRAYGEDPRRDTAGILERFAPFKWRLLVPFTQSGARLDVLELTPVAEQPPE